LLYNAPSSTISLTSGFGGSYTSSSPPPSPSCASPVAAGCACPNPKLLPPNKDVDADKLPNENGLDVSLDAWLDNIEKNPGLVVDTGAAWFEVNENKFVGGAVVTGIGVTGVVVVVLFCIIEKKFDDVVGGAAVVVWLNENKLDTAGGTVDFGTEISLPKLNDNGDVMLGLLSSCFKSVFGKSGGVDGKNDGTFVEPKKFDGLVVVNVDNGVSLSLLPNFKNELSWFNATKLVFTAVAAGWETTVATGIGANLKVPESDDGNFIVVDISSTGFEDVGVVIGVILISLFNFVTPLNKPDDAAVAVTGLL